MRNAFQSLIGRLKTGVVAEDLHDEHAFQSLIGRLKTVV